MRELRAVTHWADLHRVGHVGAVRPGGGGRGSATTRTLGPRSRSLGLEGQLRLAGAGRVHGRGVRGHRARHRPGDVRAGRPRLRRPGASSCATGCRGCWAQVMAGELPAWKARRIAEQTIPLDAEAAAATSTRSSAPFAAQDVACGRITACGRRRDPAPRPRPRRRARATPPPRSAGCGSRTASTAPPTLTARAPTPPTPTRSTTPSTPSPPPWAASGDRRPARRPPRPRPRRAGRPASTPSTSRPPPPPTPRPSTAPTRRPDGATPRPRAHRCRPAAREAAHPRPCTSTSTSTPCRPSVLREQVAADSRTRPAVRPGACRHQAGTAARSPLAGRHRALDRRPHPRHHASRSPRSST